MSTPNVPTWALRELLDRFYRTGACDLHVEVGKPVRVRKDGELVTLDGPAVPAITFLDLIAPLAGRTDAIFMASAGWFRVVVEETALVARALPNRTTLTHPTDATCNGAPA